MLGESGTNPATAASVEIGADLGSDISGTAIIASLNSHGIVVSVNRAWKDFARDNGLRDPEFGLGQNYLTVCRKAAESGEAGASDILASLESLLAGRTRVFSTEYPCHGPTEKRWFQMIGVGDWAGPEPHFLILHLPITERKLAEDRIREARRQAEQATAAKSRFLAAAAHDLRQSVQAAMLFYQLLPGDTASVAPDAAQVRLGHCLDSLRESLDGLTDISRLDAGIVTPKREVFAVDPLLERLWIEFAPEAEARGIDFRRVASSAFVETDPALLARILRNLLANAVTYARHGKVLLGCRRAGSVLKLTVGDTGPGIEERERSLIFEDFYRGDHFGHDRSKGMGLGLSVVRRVATLLGEQVAVRSQPGRGSIFEVTVPRAGTRPTTIAVRGLEATPLRGRLIAVLDDDAARLDHLCRYYEFLGHEVLAARSGAAALQQLHTQRRIPDAIVADRWLNDRADGGSEAIRGIRNAFARPIPGILLNAGAAGPGDAAAADHADLGGHLRLLDRPAPRELATALDELLRE